VVLSGSPTITTPVIAQINDAGGNETLKLASIASAVNEVTIENAATGNAVHISATGGDASVGLHLAGKGASGYVNVQDSTDASKRIMFNASGGTTNTRTMLSSTQTVDRTLSLPDATDMLVGRATTDTLTNKTLTSPTITGGALNGTLGATTPSTVAATTISASGQITSTIDGAKYLSRTGTSITQQFQEVGNTGGNYQLGVERSTGGALVVGGTAYATVLTTTGATNIEFGVNVQKVAALTSTGLNSCAIGATTPSTVAGTTGTFSGAFGIGGVAAGSDAKLQVQGGNATTGIISRLTAASSGANAKIHYTDGFTYNWTAGTTSDAFTISRGEYQVTAGTIVGTFTSTGLNSTAIGATTPSTGAFSTLSATGQITSTTTGQFFLNNTPTTQANYMRLTNTSGNMYFGLEGATPILGGTAYDTVLVGKTGLSLSGNDGGGTQLRVTSAGAAITGTLSATGNISTTGGDVTIRGAAGGFITQNASAGGLYIANTGTSTIMRFFVTNGAAASVTALTLAADSGAATFASSLSTTGITMGSGTGTVSATAGVFSVTSDLRAKNPIGKFTKGLAEIVALADHSEIYSFKSDEKNTPRAGWYAQDVEPLIPEAVFHDGADGMASLDERPIVVALVNAVKELSARLAALESK
jgi:hypothetical protein